MLRNEWRKKKSVSRSGLQGKFKASSSSSSSNRVVVEGTKMCHLERATMMTFHKNERMT